jgi:hypothetical protein
MHDYLVVGVDLLAQEVSHHAVLMLGVAER